MGKKLFGIACIVLALCLIVVCASYAAEKETVGTKAKKLGQKVFSYPANVTKESVGVVAETTKRGTAVVTKEVKTAGQVVTGEVAKTKELVTEPITGTAEMTVKAVEETIRIPVEAAKEEPAPAAARKK